MEWNPWMVTLVRGMSRLRSAIYPSYASYRKKTSRVIPVIELTPLAT